MMPRGICAAVLLFWGFLTGNLVSAFALAFAAEAAAFTGLRWELASRQVFRLFAASVTAFALLWWIIVLNSENRLRGTAEALMWGPLVFSPIFLAQLYSASGRMDLRDLFPFLRSRRLRILEYESPEYLRVNLAWPYLGACVASASMSGIGAGFFFAGVCVLAAWALFISKHKAFPFIRWISLFLLACEMGYAGHRLLGYSFDLLQRMAVGMALRSAGASYLNHRSTDIGLITGMQDEDGVILRVWGGRAEDYPLLLRTEVYNYLVGNLRWFASYNSRAVESEADGSTWTLGSKAAPEENGGNLEISAYLPGGEGPVPLPLDACEIRGLPVSRMERQPCGGLYALAGPGLVRYRVGRGKEAVWDNPADSNDLAIASEHRELASRLAAELKLGTDGRDPRRSLAALRAHFREYRYSLEPQAGPREKSLERFLTESKTGHCEYFATATVLLLRAAGIPARYATGFLVKERSGLEGCHVARGRDSHAWAQVWMDGGWISVDNTPPSADAVPFFRPLGDLWSFAVFRFSQWRWRDGDDRIRGMGPAAAAMLAIFVAWRLFRSRRNMKKIKAGEAGAQAWKPAPSHPCFVLVEKFLASRGYGRWPWETPLSWAKRLEGTDSSKAFSSGLRALVSDYYRLRFGPGGQGGGWDAFSEKVRMWTGG